MTQTPFHPPALEVPTDAPAGRVSRVPDIPLRRENLGTFFDLATQLHLAGQLEEAGALYKQIVATDPEHADAWHQLGVLHSQKSDHVRALAQLRRAIALKSTDACYFCNLGDVFRAIGRFAEAGQSYEHALTVDPTHADALCSLAHTHLQRGDHARAEQCYRRTLELRPGHPDVMTYLAVALRHQTRLDEAATLLREAVTIAPGHPEATHLLAATTGQTTSRAPAAYVADLFDAYADTFDEHLTQQLGYDVPARMKDAIEATVQPGANGWRIADLGCGTGLCGEQVKPWASHLLGVDLSPRMVAQARRRNIYDELKVDDASTTLDDESNAFDLIVASDVFIYLGALDHVIESCARALTPGGILCFSTEADDADDYALRVSGRYAHGPAYAKRCADAAGLEIARAEEITVRQEQDTPVPGHIHVLRRAA